jgi:hypothetical protein
VATDVFEREIRLEAKKRNWDIDRGSLVRQQRVRGSANEVTDILLEFDFGFHNCTVHLDAIKVFYLPTDAQ